MKFKARKALSISLISLLLVVSFVTYFSTRAKAAAFTTTSVQLADPRPSQTGVDYIATFTVPSTTAIECIQISFKSSAAMTGTATTMTTGSSFTLSGGGLTQANWTNYAGANGLLEIYSTSPRTTTNSVLTVTWSGVTNTSLSTVYAQITSFDTETSSGATCSNQIDQSNVMALVTTGGVATTVTVDPTLTFSVAGYASAVKTAPAPNLISTASSIAFGNVSAGGSATQAAQLLTTSTNAAHGYNIYIRNNQLLTNANADPIRAQGNTVSSPASFDGSTSQSSFGFITDSTTVVFSNNTFAGLTTSNVAIDSPTAPANAATLHVEYQLQLKNVQPPGTYSNVITYTATPTY